MVGGEWKKVLTSKPRPPEGKPPQTPPVEGLSTTQPSLVLLFLLLAVCLQGQRCFLTSSIIKQIAMVLLLACLPEVRGICGLLEKSGWELSYRLQLSLNHSSQVPPASACQVRGGIVALRLWVEEEVEKC